MSVRGFRSSVMGERKKASKGWAGNFRDEFRIPKDAATPILLQRGEYEDLREEEIKGNGGVPPLKHYYAHQVYSLKLAPSGPGSYREFEVGGEQDVCDYWMSRGDKRIARKGRFAMNLLHLAVHQQQQAMQDNKPMVYADDGKNHKKGDPIFNLVEVTGRQDLRNIMNDLPSKLKSGEVVMLRKKYVDVGPGHLENLMLIDEMASKNCFCGGNLAPAKFLCEKCNDVLLDVDATNLGVKQINEFGSNRQRCGSCGHHGFPASTNICDNQQCEAPAPLSVFDVVAYVRKHGEGTNSSVVIEKIVPLMEFQLPDGSYLIEDYVGEIPKWTEPVGKVSTQFDFERVFIPPKPQYAAQILGKDNPFEDRSQGASAYANQQGQSQQAETPSQGGTPPGLRRPGFKR